MLNSSSTPPKVFISYSHDSQEHKDRVLSLADYLVQKGIDCSLDEYEQFPPQGWQNWMLDQLEWADFVLIVCTEIYHRRFRGQETPGEGKGGTWEGGIISQKLYDAQGKNTKFIPVIFSSEDGKHIPTIIRKYNRYKIDSQEGFDSLYRYLTNQHDTPKPELGEIEKRPTRDRKQLFEPEKSKTLDNQQKTKSKSTKFFAYDDEWVGRDSLIDDLSSRVRKSCRLLILVGITGIGKTALGERLTIELEDWFDNNWENYLKEDFDNEEQSYDFASVAARLLEKCGEPVTPEDRKDTQRLLNRLVRHLQENRYLIQIDSLEKILEGNEEEGWNDFKDEWWVKFWESFLKTDSCQSSIILTSQDFPQQIEEKGTRFRNFWHYQLLSGLEKSEQLALFGKTGLDVSNEAEGKPYLERIGRAYEGHPLALRVIAGEIANRPFNKNVMAYWNEYGNEVEEVEKAIEEAKSSGVTVGADDSYNLQGYTRSLRRNVKSRLEKTYNRLRKDVRNAYLLLCESSVYRCEVSKDFWLSHLEDWDIEEEDWEKALDTLRDRFLVEEMVDEDSNVVMVRQHNLIRGVSLEHLKKLDDEDNDIKDSLIPETLTNQQKPTVEISPETIEQKEMNYRIFDNLSSNYISGLKKIFQHLFGQISSIDAKKSILQNSGIDNNFIDTLIFNSSNNEFIETLISKFTKYKVSSSRKQYHPMIAFMEYILKQQRQYNLDDREIELLKEVVKIGKEKLKALFG